ncbi:MAG: thioesterase domain-containing protein [Ginsengibacter sp.]
MDDITKTAASNKPLSYFRHKGIKVKFEDIEKALLSCELVKEAAVLSGEDMEGNRNLVAYIVPNGAYDENGIKEYLSDNVAAYMIPSLWVCLEYFPLTSDGSIDMDTLKDPSINEITCKDHIEPTNETELKLADIIKDILGLETLSMHDNFFRLGGNSLQALRVIAAVRKEFKYELDIKYFFIHPTISQLATYIQTVSVENFTGSPAKPPENSLQYTRSIVPLKEGKKELPLYIVCGGGGTAFTFEKFAYMLHESQRVLAFQHSYDSGELESYPSTIEDIAAKYVDELLVSDPVGPYALSGHCIGGAIALEMAKKLKLMGKEIKLLAMFDVILTLKNVEKKTRVKRLRNVPAGIKKATLQATLKVDFETFLLRKYPRHAIEYKVNSFKSFLNKIFRFQRENVEMMVFRKFEEKFQVAFDNYLIEKYDDDILVFYARDHYHFQDKNRKIAFKKFMLEDGTKNRWKDYARSATFYEIEGEHSTIFESQDFANILQEYLDK